MMTEESPECCGLIESKLLQAKVKRTRQRVDAGEPRNSYSSIPNFSSRPAFFSSGLYSAIFHDKHFGFAPDKMLNELLNRKSDSMITVDDGLKVDGRPSEMAHNMLRDILQGRKKELLALENELRNGIKHESIDNNNTITNNNNVKYPKESIDEGKDAMSVESEGDSEEIRVKTEDSDSESSVLSKDDYPKSPERAPKIGMDVKRARVENIVSTMRSSPTPVVNGCKKRKLYHPQQHDVTERYDNGIGDVNMDDSDPEAADPPELRQKIVEKNALKNQLRTMQEQLAEMQHKYVQLCSRMDMGSETQEVEDADTDVDGSDTEAKKPAPPPPPPPMPQMLLPNLPMMHDHPPMNYPPPNFNPAMYHKLFLEQEARKEEMKAKPQFLPQKRPSEFSDRLSMFRTVSNPVSGTDLEGLADVLKTEITSSLTNLIDTIIGRFVHQRRLLGKQAEAASVAAEQLNKDLMMASQMLDRKSPRTKVIDRQPERMTPQKPALTPTATPANTPNSETAQSNGPIRPSPSMFHTPKLPGGSSMYPTMMCMSSESRDSIPEQNEALSLVVAPKKKRHKVTDTRITPRTVSRILAQDSPSDKPFGLSGGSTNDSPPPPPPPRPYHPLPVSLPTSVAIPNPSLHESQVFSPYSPFFHQHPHINGSPPGMMDHRESPPLPNPPTMLHPALLAAAHHSATPDYVHFRSNSAMQECGDRGSEGNTPDGHFDGLQPSSSTLTPMHLRKAKLMFFWVRYPSSAVLKMYFPDIMFNKNNTAQLVKWFSNFREFYYIQMEKYARQAVSEGVKIPDDLHVNIDSEIYRVLNLHYNRNNHIEVPSNFRFVVEQTLREFFKAIQTGKDAEQSWKKSIYKIISRLDDPVPDYFKSPNFLEQLE